jgi:5-methylcytosine-specific restriction endonuclease McrA
MEQEIVAFDDVGRATDQELIARLRRLVRADRTLSARMLVHLGEVDARGLYREYACPSMFEYCVEELHMSGAEAYLRIQAARLGRQFPLIVQLFANGSLHLTAIKLLGPHLTPDNHVQLLERASGMKKREIELLVAALAPKPDVPSRMRKLPETSPARMTPAPAPVAPIVHARPAVLPSQAPIAAPALPANQAPLVLEAPDAPAAPASRAPLALQATIAAPAPHAIQESPFALEAPRPAGSFTPLRPGRYRLELTAGQALHDKVEQLRHLLRHQVPDGNLATIVELAVDLLVDKTMKKRFAQNQSPTPKKPGSVKLGVRRRKLRSRYIPRAVVREVHRRDAGQCTFVSSDGKRCCERGFLELHHRIPYARGGAPTAENLTLACRPHNALFAERDFGAGFMRSKLRHARTPSRGVSSESNDIELVPERVPSLILFAVAPAKAAAGQHQATTRIRPACGP